MLTTMPTSEPNINLIKQTKSSSTLDFHIADKMTVKPIIAVTGATGLQGGSVINHLLQSGSFRIRGLSRDVSTSRSKELSERDVEMAAANMDDVESLKRAFKGCYGVYAVTNCWEHGWDAETRHGKNMVDAAKAVGIKHFVFSTMGNLQAKNAL